MEFSSSNDYNRVKSTLNQIKTAISQLKEWNADIKSAEDYYGSSSGMQKLAASCMLIEAIGEGITISSCLGIARSSSSNYWLNKISPDYSSAAISIRKSSSSFCESSTCPDDSDELERLCAIHEAQCGDSQQNVTRFETEQHSAEQMAKSQGY